MNQAVRSVTLSVVQLIELMPLLAFEHKKCMAWKPKMQRAHGCQHRADLNNGERLAALVALVDPDAGALA